MIKQLKNSTIIKRLGSLRLTIFLLVASLVLILFGTLDQVHYGIYHTQQKYFEHVIALWQYPLQWPMGEQLSWLVFPLPAGYLLGPLLIVNLCCAHFIYFRYSWKKIGIAGIHGGIVLLLIGQLWTQVSQKEFFLWLEEGSQSNFIESFHYDEFVVIDKSPDNHDHVYSWNAKTLNKRGTQLSHSDLPFTIDVIWFSENAMVFPRPPRAGDQFPPMPYNRGIGADQNLVAQASKPTFAEGERNVATAIIQIKNNEEDLGTWLVSNIFRQTLPVQSIFPSQSFEYEGKTWEIALRFTREYLPSDIKLIDFNHDRYPGTDIPFNFSSKVSIINETNETSRDTLIYMNHPLRYAGYTFYQASFADNDTKSMFQVVRNPARWIPYAACVVITLGLLLQFMYRLGEHLLKSKKVK